MPHYCNPDCLSCPAHLNNTGWATPIVRTVKHGLQRQF